jgi:hypothetical protein
MKGRVECNAQLESEGTGEDGGQEDSIPADDAPKRFEKFHG